MENLAHTIINADDVFAMATNMLAEDLPRVDTCDADERDAFIEEIRAGLTIKVRQAILLSAFRERDGTVDLSLSDLCVLALKNIEDPSYAACVQEFVLLKYGITDRPELHPSADVARRQAALFARRMRLAVKGIVD